MEKCAQIEVVYKRENQQNIVLDAIRISMDWSHSLKTKVCVLLISWLLIPNCRTCILDLYWIVAYREQRFEEIQPNRYTLTQKEGASPTLLYSFWGQQTELGTPRKHVWAQHGDTKGNSLSPASIWWHRHRTTLWQRCNCIIIFLMD